MAASVSLICGVKAYATVKNHSKTCYQEGVFVRESLHLLRQDEKAVFLLGLPIRNYMIDYKDTANTFASEEEARVMLPVAGVSGEGQYHLLARPDDQGRWGAVRCELELTRCEVLGQEKWRDRRLVVFDKERHGDVIAVNEGWGK